MEEEAWAAVGAALGVALPPETRRANLLVRGVALAGTRGRVLRVAGCRLRVFTQVPPCRVMDDAHAGLQAALRPAWRGGVAAEVLEGGPIATGDVVEWEDRDDRA
jgi:MOSC domain-containing protein YiiM